MKDNKFCFIPYKMIETSWNSDTYGDRNYGTYVRHKHQTMRHACAVKRESESRGGGSGHFRGDLQAIRLHAHHSGMKEIS